MYAYIYDIFTKDKKYTKQIQKIESILTELGINGKSYKLNVLKNLDDIVDEIQSMGIKNIIMVGNDQSLSKLASLIINKDIVLGIIPIGEPNIFAKALGIKQFNQACQTIAARKVASFDIGKANRQYFLLAVEAENKNVIFDYQDYNINPLKNNQKVGVYNVNITSFKFGSNPGDGKMEAVFMPKENGFWSNLFKKNKDTANLGVSVFPVKNLTIQHKKRGASVLIDRQRSLKTPVEIEVLKNKLKIIVGKQRMF